jgi:hypothetical protein
MRLLLTLTLFLSSVNSLAETTELFKPSNKWKSVSAVKLGARFYSIWESRGVVQYADYQLLPFAAVFMFEDDLEFLPSYISYRHFLYEDKIRFRTRLQKISDNPILPKHESIESIYPDREDSSEWVNRLELFFPSYANYKGEIDLGIHNDLQAHHGVYVELMGKLQLLTFENTFLKKTTIEPNLFFSLGYGDKRHNEYYYGAVDSDGLNNISYGLWFNALSVADRNNPTITIKRFEVLGDKNKNGLLARDRNEGYSFIFTYSHDLLK